MNKSAIVTRLLLQLITSFLKNIEEILSFPWPIINHTGAATPRLNLPVRSLPLLPAPPTHPHIFPVSARENKRMGEKFDLFVPVVALNL